MAVGVIFRLTVLRRWHGEMFERDRDPRVQERPEVWEHAVTQTPDGDLLVFDIDDSSAWVRSDVFEEVRQ